MSENKDVTEAIGNDDNCVQSDQSDHLEAELEHVISSHCAA